MSKYDNNDEDTPWVHESDYGSFAMGGIITGFFMVVISLGQLVYYGIKSLFTDDI